MNRLIERELAEKAEQVRNAVDGARTALLYATAAPNGKWPVDPTVPMRLLRLAALITEYNTLQALQAEIDS